MTQIEVNSRIHSFIHSLKHPFPTNYSLVSSQIAYCFVSMESTSNRSIDIQLKQRVENHGAVIKKGIFLLFYSYYFFLITREIHDHYRNFSKCRFKKGDNGNHSLSHKLEIITCSSLCPIKKKKAPSDLIREV